MSKETEEYKKVLKASSKGLKLIDLLKRSRKVHEFYLEKGWTWNPFEQIGHCHAEVSEIWDVLRNKKNKYGITMSKEWQELLLGECSDAVITVLTVYYILGLSDEQFIDAFKKTIEKLEKRVKEEISIYRHAGSVKTII